MVDTAAKVCMARALKDFSPAEKAFTETERKDALVDIDKDVIDGHDKRDTPNSADKNGIPEGRPEPSVIPSRCSSPVLPLTPPIAKEPTQKPDHDLQFLATKATSTSTNTNSLDNDKSTEDEQMTAVKVKKIKPQPKPIKCPVNSTLMGTCKNKTHTGPTLKEILTLAEHTKHQSGSVLSSSAE
ncbi:hypothetical protein ARMGADRAFT_1025557 [Armillaria gallica]|uniref:Uncharacterized protein n=1 Tax=Armillaria gallica TaxID=47427 RepID=A0A2H3DVR6_ARMGA|nr:hypothetical protein ARMGADRAFT_1025557 [Armillaria gallica]